MRLVERIGVAAFDLDGTLVDTAPDLAAAANAMLATFGLAPLAQARIERLIGGGVERLVAGAFSEAAGRAARADELPAAIDGFGQSYARALFQRGGVYPGVVEGMRTLAALGIELACITNKASRFTRPLLDAAGLADWFALVLCADEPSQRKPAPSLLLAACEHFRVSPPELLYVGDSRTDVATARAAGCPVAIVDYGYDHGPSPAEETPDWLIGSIAAVASLRIRERHAAHHD